MADDPTQPPGDPHDRLEAMIQALAGVTATEQLKGHAEAHQLTEELRARMSDLVVTTRRKLDEAEQRKQIAAQVDALVDQVGRIKGEVGRAVSQSGDRVKASARADTIGQMADALRLLAEWIADPTTAKQQRVDALIDGLRAITGADPYLDDARAEARMKAEIEADVKKSLDEIFGQLKIVPPL